MLERFCNLRTRIKLVILASTLLTGLIICGLFSLWILEAVKIHGHYYNSIVAAKDYLADTLPPALYIVEPFWIAFDELDEDAEQLKSSMEKMDGWHTIFEERNDFWQRYFPPGKMRDTYLVDAQRNGENFFEMWKNQFVPLLQNAITQEIHDKELKQSQMTQKPQHSDNKEETIKTLDTTANAGRLKAQALLQGPMKDLFMQQKQNLEAAFEPFSEFHTSIEEELTALYNTRGILITIWAIFIVLGVLLSIFTIRTTNRLFNGIAIGISNASTQIEARMNGQAQAIAQESSSVHETTSAMDELNSSFEHTELLAQDASGKAKQALQLSENGNQVLKQMLDGLFSHKEKVFAIVEQTRLLSQIVAQIHQIASVTNNLTNQTNILALNAAVQAANVKQHSEGFTVIASEIRKLADESKRFLTHIEVLAENIQRAIDSMQGTVEEGSRTIQDNIKLGQSSLHSFESIIMISKSSFEGAEQVCLNLKQQGRAVHQVLEAMEVVNESAAKTLLGLNEIREELHRLDGASGKLKNAI